ncbi:MAG: HD domain-containing protein [Nitrospiraceae bacterium]|nr:HD domain-containing protein [Nitrospiraceae bacterium]
MTEEDFARLKRRFLRYVRDYRMETPAERQNIALKRAHTLRVCRNMGFITRGEGISGADARLARAAALLHDAGRFPQYARWRTFNDAASANHGLLGVEAIGKAKLLEGISRGERSLIIRAVKYHNALALPRLDKRSLLFLKLVRDADKLDIWNVFIEYFGQEKKDRPTAAGQGLPEGKGISPASLRGILENRVVRLAEVKSLNDYKLLLLSWVFGLNFGTTFRLLRKRRLLERLAATLPRGQAAGRVIAHLEKFVSLRSS